MGITYQTLAQWENDLRKPKLATIQRIADALGVCIEDLLGLESFDGGAEFEKRRKELMEKSGGDTLTVIHTKDPRKIIDSALDLLNDAGRMKAAERVYELTEIPRYRKDAPDDQKPQDEG